MSISVSLPSKINRINVSTDQITLGETNQLTEATVGELAKLYTDFKM